MSEATINTNEKVALTLRGVGVNQGDTTVQFAGNAVWSDPAGLVELTPDATGLACRAASLGVAGATEVEVVANDGRGHLFSAKVALTVVEVAPPVEDTDHIEIVVGAIEPI